MGVDLWKHMLRPFNIWNTFSDLGRYIMHGLLIGTQVSWCILAGAYQRMSILLAGGRLWRGHLTTKPKSKHRRNVSLSGKSGQIMVPASSENINLASREIICAQMILKSRHSLRFGVRVRICIQRLATWESPTALRVTSFELHVVIS